MSKLSAICFALLVLTAQSTRAQSIAGTLVDKATGKPIPAAMVILFDANNHRSAATLSDAEGRFILKAPAEGRYRLRADRIGYTASNSPLLTIGSGILTYRFEVDPQAVSIQALQVTARERQCRALRDGIAVQTLWDEARKALEATEWTERNRAVRFSLARYERDLDPQGLAVVRESRTLKEGFSVNPFVTLPPEELASKGFARLGDDESFVYAPDAHVLLSDAFLDNHCFRVEPMNKEGLIGLAFQPVRGQTKADVNGVLWLDPNSSELRTMTFRFVNLPEPLQSFDADGHLQFERMSTGAWIVRRWRITTPQVTVRSVGTIAQRVAYRGTLQSPVLLGNHEEGGAVISAVAAGRSTTANPATGILSGVVYDSVTNTPLAHANVYLSGTEHTQQTGVDGSFKFWVPSGTYDLAYTHPLLDSLKLPVRLNKVSVNAHETATANVSSPSLLTIMNQVCSNPDGKTSGGMIYGTVRDRTGVPLSSVEVRAEWMEFSQVPRRMIQAYQQVTTQSDGRYAICFVPLDMPITLEINGKGILPTATEVRLPRGGVLSKDLK